MLVLLPDEVEVSGLGREIEIPLSLAKGQFCFHLCIWFLTGVIPNLPEAPSYNAYIRQSLVELKSKEVLRWGDPTFEAVSREDLRTLQAMSCLPKGIYLIHLLDKIRGMGHWVVLTEAGVFESRVNRMAVPFDKWISLFQKRYGVRRIFPISCTEEG